MIRGHPLLGAFFYGLAGHIAGVNSTLTLMTSL